MTAIDGGPDLGRLSGRLVRWAAAHGRQFRTSEAARKFGPETWNAVRRLEARGYLAETGKHVYLIAPIARECL